MNDKSNQKFRYVYFVDDDFLVEGEGYRASIIVDGDKGHRPTGTWPYTGDVGETLPLFFGPTIADARKRVNDLNARMGIDAREAAIIVARSMAA